MSHNYPPPPPIPPTGPPAKSGMSTGAKWVTGCGIAVLIGMVLLVGGCMAAIIASPGGDSVEPADPPAAGASEESDGGSGGGEEEKAAAIGDTVESGAFAFTVTEVETGVMEVSDESGFMTETPDGQYVVVHVTVENIGEESGYFESSSQKLVDKDGKQYSTDTAAEITGGAESFLNEINPGNSVDGQLVFDVPEGTKLDKLELADFISFDKPAVVDISGV